MQSYCSGSKTLHNLKRKSLRESGDKRLGSVKSLVSVRSFQLAHGSLYIVKLIKVLDVFPNHTFQLINIYFFSVALHIKTYNYI